MPLAGRVPGGLRLTLAPLGSRAFRRLPPLWGGMAKHSVPDEIMDGWFEPVLTRPDIRRYLRKYVTSVPDAATLWAWARQQAGFDRPVLVVWATEDHLMPRGHARRLAELFPNARLAEVTDSYTLIPEDQPEELASALRAFLIETDQSDRNRPV
ncbi:MAG: alpha/beta fold hydrolase [Streptosporangiaceae bacterium]